MLWFLITTFWKSGPNVTTTLVNGFKVGEVSLFKDYKLVDAKNLINNQASNKKQLYICNKGNK